MPKRPCKKGIEFQFDALWGMENQSEDVIEEEEVVETETVEVSVESIPLLIGIRRDG